MMKIFNKLNNLNASSDLSLSLVIPYQQHYRLYLSPVRVQVSNEKARSSTKLVKED